MTAASAPGDRVQVERSVERSDVDRLDGCCGTCRGDGDCARSRRPEIGGWMAFQAAVADTAAR